ncbi:Crp/Fnr family transcriptional regulator [uncultured Cytophaga sp.]|uniref:Crp/Fnr family transcriptional regulator n=1 Tax=uncultured Cytophaga sp. TaxID=160238 RepID=UPI002609AB52|nr:Crp/Fnr family transcriptional regulator [uncultured Cytophaga sp.]
MKELIDTLFTNEISVPAKTVLIKDNTHTDKLYFIKKGSVRVFYKKGNKEVTAELFLDNKIFTSAESFLFNESSIYIFETMEDSILKYVTKESFDAFLKKSENSKDFFYQTLLKQSIGHIRSTVDLLKYKPEERYRRFILQEPNIINRIPLNIIASYLGITNVSLSRIKNRKQKVS